MKNLSKYFILTYLLFSDFLIYAQPGDDDGGGGLEGDDPPAAPINSKLILLAIMAMTFVLYTYRKNKKTILKQSSRN